MNDTLRTIWNGFDFSYLLEIVLGIIPSLLCITLHELAHGYTAYRLGDDTAKRAGRLTLNPLKHLDPIGLLMMLVFHFGWAKLRKEQAVDKSHDRVERHRHEHGKCHHEHILHIAVFLEFRRSVELIEYRVDHIGRQI